MKSFSIIIKCYFGTIVIYFQTFRGCSVGFSLFNPPISTLVQIIGEPTIFFVILFGINKEIHEFDSIWYIPLSRSIIIPILNLSYHSYQCSTYSIYLLLVGKIFYWVSMHFIFGNHVRFSLPTCFITYCFCKEKFDVNRIFSIIALHLTWLFQTRVFKNSEAKIVLTRWRLGVGGSTTHVRQNTTSNGLLWLL